MAGYEPIPAQRLAVYIPPQQGTFSRSYSKWEQTADGFSKMLSASDLLKLRLKGEARLHRVDLCISLQYDV
jgi:hypothetical protein